jgi:N-formylglutamate deformylase
MRTYRVLAALTVVAVQARLDTCYHPYRQALASAVLDAHTRHGEVWHFNCHSMKSRGNAMNVDAGALRPDIVVSDRRGTTADPAVTAWVAAWFEARGFTTRINDPYQGGDLVRSLGKPSAGRHSVQVEINRAIYMCEDTFERGERFDTLRETLSAFVGDAVAHLRTRRERRASR